MAVQRILLTVVFDDPNEWKAFIKYTVKITEIVLVIRVEWLTVKKMTERVFRFGKEMAVREFQKRFKLVDVREATRSPFVVIYIVDCGKDAVIRWAERRQKNSFTFLGRHFPMRD